MPKNFANAYAATAAAAASDHRTHRQLLLRALGVVYGNIRPWDCYRRMPS